MLNKMKRQLVVMIAEASNLIPYKNDFNISAKLPDEKAEKLKSRKRRRQILYRKNKIKRRFARIFNL